MTFSIHEKNMLISQLEAALTAVKNMPCLSNCHTCANFDLRGGPALCRAAGVEVPLEVQAVGCEAHIYDHTLPPF